MEKPKMMMVGLRAGCGHNSREVSVVPSQAKVDVTHRGDPTQGEGFESVIAIHGIMFGLGVSNSRRAEETY